MGNLYLPYAICNTTKAADMHSHYSALMSVALVIQHAMRMRRIILSSVACPAVPHVPTLLHKSYDFRVGGAEYWT